MRSGDSPSCLERMPSQIRLLRRVMDGNVIAQELQRHWRYSRIHDYEVIDVTVDRIYPNKNGTYSMLFEVKLSRGHGTWTQPLLGELVDSDPMEHAQRLMDRLTRPRCQLAARDPEGHISALPNLNLVVRTPGLDDKIDGLRIVYSPASYIASLGLDQFAALEQMRVQVLSHRLGKRCVVRFLCDDHRNTKTTSLIVKLYKNRRNRAAPVHAAMSSLAASVESGAAYPITPPPLFFDQAENAVVMEDISGTPITFRDTANAPQTAQLAGQLIGQLHQERLSDECLSSPDHGRAEESAVFSSWVKHARQLFPEQSQALKGIENRILNQLTSIDAESHTLIHRDFHEKQIIVDEGRARLVDFDTLAMGDPAIDIGNFLAHALLAHYQTPSFQLSDYEQVKTHFLCAYAKEQPESLEPAFQHRINMYRDVALGRLCCLCFFQPRWHHLTASLISSTQSLSSK